MARALKNWQSGSCVLKDWSLPENGMIGRKPSAYIRRYNTNKNKRKKWEREQLSRRELRLGFSQTDEVKSLFSRRPSRLYT
jgi:hypothetical protein